jgi:aerobic carbon-monoxide dehydrogenase medium subunit
LALLATGWVHSNHPPTTPEAAIALLSQYQGEARLLAGGQSLVPMMNFRLVTPAAIIDLKRIPELVYVRAEDGTGRIWVMTRHRVRREVAATLGVPGA